MDRRHLTGNGISRVGLMMVVAALMLPGLTSGLLAGESLSVRLVEAHNESAGVAEGLGDVIGTLRKNLNYSGFDLLSSKRVGLPANQGVGLSRGYKVECKGEQSSLRITVFKGKDSILDTTLNLRDGSPVVLGGFQSDRGRVLLVLVAR